MPSTSHSEVPGSEIHPLWAWAFTISCRQRPRAPGGFGMAAAVKTGDAAVLARVRAATATFDALPPLQPVAKPVHAHTTTTAKRQTFTRQRTRRQLSSSTTGRPP